MKAIDPGRLKHRVRIERRSQAPGGFGQPADAWEAVLPGTVAAEVLPISGRERLAAFAVQGSHTHTVLVRWHALLDVSSHTAAHWRIVHGTRTYNVRACSALQGSRQWLVFDVEEGGADGH